MGQTFELQTSTAPRNGTSRTRPLSSADQYEVELDEMRSKVCRFPDDDPADVLATISGLAGRLAEIRAQLYRDNSQRCTQLRTREVDPLRDDLDLQFKIWSRKIALLEWELRMSGGGI
jgi:hypothetical protein